jgi:HicB_like antitoxin of bacterial toxin-antitoxin system
MKPAGWVLALIIQGMIEDGDAVPEPSKIDAMAEDAAKQHAIAFMVSVEAPDATVCVNLTARESQIEKIDQLAEAADMARSAYMVRSAIGEEKQRGAIAQCAGKVRGKNRVRRPPSTGRTRCLAP